MGEKPTRHFSDFQEKSVARELGGRRTPNSGATPFAKGDVVCDGLLVECKTAERPQKKFSIAKEWFSKADSERMGMRLRLCAIAFSFGDGENFYAVDSATFREMYGAWLAQGGSAE